MFKPVVNEINNCGVFYDDVQSVCDYSQYRPDAEMVRSLKFNPEGANQEPVFDYPKGTPEKGKEVTPEIIALRSGKLDRAEASQLADRIIKSAQMENDKANADKITQAVYKAVGIGSEANKASE